MKGGNASGLDGKAGARSAQGGVVVDGAGTGVESGAEQACVSRHNDSTITASVRPPSRSPPSDPNRVKSARQWECRSRRGARRPQLTPAAALSRTESRA